jgi:hypothetical protein
METIFYLCGFFVLCCIGTWLAERREGKNLMPPPDRSVKRNIEIADDMNRLNNKHWRQV